MTCSQAFSRAWRQLHVFASSCDWLIALFASVVIGQSDYCGLGFTALKWQLLLLYYNTLYFQALQWRSTWLYYKLYYLQIPES